MTTDEILDYMKIRLDVVSSGGAPGYDDDDFSVFYNVAQKHFSKRYENDKANPTRTGAEMTEKRSKDLSELKGFEDVFPVSFSAGDHGSDSYFVDLPVNFWLTLGEEATITYDDACGDEQTDRVNVKPIKEDYYSVNKRSAYKKPYAELLWRLDRERLAIGDAVSASNRKRHELIAFDGATLDVYHVSYYRVPKDVDLTNINDFCEFHEMQHEKIADIAVELMMQSTGRAELQSKMAENARIIE